MTQAPTHRRRKQRRGVPNKLDPALAEALAGDDTGAEWGPAMKALPSDRHRAFVLALYKIRPGYGAHVKAAKLAGFGTSKSSAQSWSTIAARLAHDEESWPPCMRKIRSAFAPAHRAQSAPCSI